MIDAHEPVRSDGFDSSPVEAAPAIAAKIEAAPVEAAACILADGCQRIARQALLFLTETAPDPDDPTAAPSCGPTLDTTQEPAALRDQAVQADPADFAGRLEVLAGLCADTVRLLTGSGNMVLALKPSTAEAETRFRFGSMVSELEAMAENALSDAGSAGKSGPADPVADTSAGAGSPSSRDAAIIPLCRAGRCIGVLVVAAPDAGQMRMREEMVALTALGGAFCDAWLALDSQHRLLSERQQARGAAAQAERLGANHTQFLGVLSHELRNPATALVMGLSLLDIVAPDSPQGLRAREIMRNQTMLLVHLLDELQDVTRLERRTLTLQRDVVDLAHVAQGAVIEMQDAFNDQDVQLQVDLPERPMRMRGDPARLADMIRQLLDNALRASSAGGSVWLRMGPDPAGQTVTIDVKDEGRGIAASELPVLFQPFALADHQFDRIRNGLGIGLAIAKGVAELHGGQMTAQSDGPGKGARFVVSLPLLAEVPAPLTAQGQPPSRR